MTTAIQDNALTDWDFGSDSQRIHGAVLGGAGSGKSTVLTALARAARGRGFDIMYVPGGIVEHPPLRALASSVHAPGTAAVELQDITSRRALLYNAHQRFERPLAVLIDDAEDVFQSPGQAREWDVALRFARKLNIAAVAAVNDWSLGRFGGSDYLRSSLLGQFALLRSRRLSLPVCPPGYEPPDDLHELPPGHGYLYRGSSRNPFAVTL